MENNGYSLTDIVTALGGMSGGMGGGNVLWLFFIFMFITMFNGGWGNRGGMYGDATQQEILFNQHFSNLDNKIDRIGNGIADATFALNASIKDGNAAVAGTVTAEGRALQSQLSDYYCKTQSGMDNMRFEMANFANAINANINEKAAAADRRGLEQTIAAQAARINQLELSAQMCGVVRYPNGMMYNAGTSPFCNCNNSCCN